MDKSSHGGGASQGREGGGFLRGFFVEFSASNNQLHPAMFGGIAVKSGSMAAPCFIGRAFYQAICKVGIAGSKQAQRFPDSVGLGNHDFLCAKQGFQHFAYLAPG